MLTGYARVKSDGTQVLDPQIDPLIEHVVTSDHIYTDYASGKNDERPGLLACLKALRAGDVLIVWKLDRLGRNLRNIVTTVLNLSEKGVGFKVLVGQGANIDNATSSGKLIFGIFAALAEFERELISKRTKSALTAARKAVQNSL